MTYYVELDHSASLNVHTVTVVQKQNVGIQVIRTCILATFDADEAENVYRGMLRHIRHVKGDFS